MQVTEDRTVGFKQYCDNVKLSNDCIVIKSMNDLRDCIKQYCIDAIHTPSVIITSDAMLNMQLLNVLYEYQLRIQRMYKPPFTSFLTENATPSQTSVNINRCIRPHEQYNH